MAQVCLSSNFGSYSEIQLHSSKEDIQGPHAPLYSLGTQSFSPIRVGVLSRKPTYRRSHQPCYQSGYTAPVRTSLDFFCRKISSSGNKVEISRTRKRISLMLQSHISRGSPVYGRCFPLLVSSQRYLIPKSWSNLNQSLRPSYCKCFLDLASLFLVPYFAMVHQSFPSWLKTTT